MNKWFYVYILKNTKTKKYFYVGSSTKPEERLKTHQSTFGNQIKMIIIQKLFTNRTNANKLERYWINQLSFYGVDLHNINHHTTRDQRKKIIKPPKTVTKAYIKKLNWINLTDEQKNALFKPLPYGNYTKIAKSIGRHPETIRRLFSLKPDKILIDHYQAILKHITMKNVKEPI